MSKKIKFENSNWKFSGNIPKNFDNHIKKSIPFYEDSHKIGLMISDFFLPDNSNYSDLGCSTGKFIKALSLRHKNKNIKFTGYDSILEMVNLSKKICKNDKRISIKKKDILIEKFKDQNFITSFYTLQFVHPSNRQKLFNKIFKSLKWGGGFLFFEKVRAKDARFQDMTNQIYTEIKINNGFSSEDIIQKSRSLKGVMEPFSSLANIQLAKRAGFKDIMTVFKYINFEGFLAIK